MRWQGVAGERGRELEIVLPEKLVVLEGWIVDAEGNSLGGAQVTVSGARPPKPAETDANGAFRFPRVVPGPRLLAVTHPDIGRIEKEVRIEGSPARLDIQMPRATLVQGRVTGRDGSPVANPSVSVDFGHVEADSEGRFRFNVPAGEHVVRVNARSWALLERTITATGEPIELSLEMSRPATVFGRVTGLLPGDRRLVKLKEGGTVASSPDEEGRFQIPGVAHGTWTLVASDANGRTVERLIQVEEGRDLTVEDLSFPPLPEVRGRVFDPEGRPAVYANLTFEQEEKRWVHAATDPEGRFTAHLVDGTWAVRVEMSGLGAATTFTMPNAPLEIPDLRLAQAVALTGYVHGLAPGEIPLIQATSEDGLWAKGVHAGQDLAFHIPDLWPGNWTLTAMLDGRKASTQVRIVPGDTAVRADVSFEED